jgi:lysophospholipase L1-like esterase
VAAIAVGLLVGEGAVRVLARQSVAVPWQDEVDGIPAPRPNVRRRHAVPAAFDVRVSFNAQRFRGAREFAQEPRAGVVRLAVLGDSFTFGYGANDDETYPAQLEQILGEHLAKSASGTTVEVVNAGNGGTGTGDQALWYDIWVKRFRPGVVVLTVTSNDVDDDLSRAMFLPDGTGGVAPRSREDLRRAGRPLRFTRDVVKGIPGYGFVAQHSQLLGLARNAVSAAIAGERRAAFADAGRWSEAERFGSEGLPLMMGEVRWLAQRVRESGAELAVVFVPSRESVYPSAAPSVPDIRWRSDAIVHALTRMCAAEGIAFADLTGEVRKRAGDVREALYYAGLDTHPTPLGYGMIAGAVATFLLDRGLLRPTSAAAQDPRGI